VSAHGVLYVHSAPPALCPHVEWAVAGIVGAPVGMPWVGQSAAPGAMRAELAWQARPGTAGEIASALAGWNRLRFEVTEDSSPGCDGVRYCYTPDLGIFTAVTGANGDILVPEDRLRAAMGMALRLGESLEDEIGRLLGTAWDNELETFRRAADGAPVRWLNAVLARGAAPGTPALGGFHPPRPPTGGCPPPRTPLAGGLPPGLVSRGWRPGLTSWSGRACLRCSRRRFAPRPRRDR
jgi:Protein of unknown function (DUF3145)